MYNEDDFLQLSALQHFVFCPRQCALIHIEQAWVENMFTAQGRVMHDKAHEEKFETREGVRIERGLPLCSKQLGLNGKADVVEFHKPEDLRSQISNLKSSAWLPFPVEYKRGKPKPDDCDKVQLCAQAMCLEEMLEISIEKGALFYGKTRRRLEVEFTGELRKETKETARHLHEFIKAGVTPKPQYSKKCETCSLKEVCLPKAADKNVSVKEYIKREIAEP